MNENTKETNENEPKTTANSEKTVSAPEEGSAAAEAETSGPLPAVEGERPEEADGVPGKGKIARLPHKIREKLNRRLRDGENGTTLLGWLNKLPTTRKVLRKEFRGEPIGKQNLSRWVQNGYQSWLRKQEAFEQVRQALDEAEQFEETGSKDLTERVAVWLSMRCALEAQKLGEVGTDADLAALGRLCRGLSALRRGEHSARRLKLEEKRLELSRGEGSETLEKMFWKWTERPDIKKKLRPRPPTFKARMRAIRRVYGLPLDDEPPTKRSRRGHHEEGAAEIERRMAELDREKAELERRKAEIERRKAGEVHPPALGSYGATGSPKSEAQSREGNEDKMEGEVERNGNGAGAGMTNDECQMTKEARMTKSESNGAVQGPKAEGNPNAGQAEDPLSQSYGEASPPAQSSGSASEIEVQSRDESEDPPSPRLRRAGEDENEQERNGEGFELEGGGQREEPGPE